MYPLGCNINKGIWSGEACINRSLVCMHVCTALELSLKVSQKNLE